jgi:hypothetical protein
MSVSRAIVLAVATRSHVSQAVCALSSLGGLSGDWAKRVYVVDYEPPPRVVDGVEVAGLPMTLQALATETLRPDYSWSEICFALKPLILQYELDAGRRAAVYVDSDLFFVGGAADFLEDVAGHPVSLTPHYLAPRRFEDHPSELTLLRSGLFNGGFISVANHGCARSFLAWWSYRAARLGYNEPTLGMCGDQRWLDLVPLIFDAVNVVKREGVNVGYWNIVERPLFLSHDGSILAGNDLLVCFHFSGFSPLRPESLGKYTKRKIDEGSALQRLCQDYMTKLNLSDSKVDGVCFGAASQMLHWYVSNRSSRFRRSLMSVSRRVLAFFLPR